MSLSRLALRMAAVRAIRGATLAEGRVFDSDVNPLDHRINADPAPVIIVYTDDHVEAPRGRADMLTGNTSCDLVIEMAVAGRVLVPQEDAPAVSIAETNAGTEMSLDLMERQVVAALTGRAGTWPDLWRIFCVAVRQRVSRRAASEESGVRFAARQLVLTCDMLMDPPVGLAFTEDSAWARWIAAVEADPSIAPVAPVLLAAIRGEVLDADVTVLASLGVNIASSDGLGVGSIIAGEEPPDLTGGVMEQVWPDA